MEQKCPKLGYVGNLVCLKHSKLKGNRKGEGNEENSMGVGRIGEKKE